MQYFTVTRDCSQACIYRCACTDARRLLPEICPECMDPPLRASRQDRQLALSSSPSTTVAVQPCPAPPLHATPVGQHPSLPRPSALPCLLSYNVALCPRLAGHLLRAAAASYTPCARNARRLRSRLPRASHAPHNRCATGWPAPPEPPYVPLPFPTSGTKATFSRPTRVANTTISGRNAASLPSFA